MPHLVKPWIVSYVGADGKRCKKRRGATMVRTRARKWYGVGIPGHPRRKRVPLAANRAAAQRMLDDLVRAAEQGEAKLPDVKASRRTLADHLEEFEKDVARGTATRSRRRRPPTPAQASLVVQRVRAVLEGCDFAFPADLDSEAPGKLADYLQGRVAAKKSEGGLSHQSAAFHLAAAKRFVWWLSRRRVPVRPDLLDEVPGFEPAANRVHARRQITPEEIARILEATLADPIPRRGLTGRDRYHLYLVAFATGFRAGELAALTDKSFRLDTDPPTVRIEAKRTKAKRARESPLPAAVAVQMRSYLADRSGVVWPGTWSEKPAKVLRRDLAAAKVPYVVDGGHADFHSLRHSFASALAAAGAGPKELQELVGHADPRLTLGLYTHTTKRQLARTVELLPLPGVERDAIESATREQVDAALRLTIAVLGMMVQAEVQTLGTTHIEIERNH